MPIRLWSTVTSQDAMRPLFQVTGYGASDLAATRRRSLVDVRLEVPLECAELLLGPVAADTRHPAAAFPHDRLECGRLHERRVRRERRPVVTLCLQPVALRAHALPLRLAELLGGMGRDEALEIVLALDDRAREHALVVDAAELCALALERPDLL